MRKLTAFALIALALSAGAPAAMANNRYDRNWQDWSKACQGFDCNSPQGNRAFWEQQQNV